MRKSTDATTAGCEKKTKQRETALGGGGGGDVFAYVSCN